MIKNFYINFSKAGSVQYSVVQTRLFIDGGFQSKWILSEILQSKKSSNFLLYFTLSKPANEKITHEL